VLAALSPCLFFPFTVESGRLPPEFHLIAVPLITAVVEDLTCSGVDLSANAGSTCRVRGVFTVARLPLSQGLQLRGLLQSFMVGKMHAASSPRFPMRGPPPFGLLSQKGYGTQARGLAALFSNKKARCVWLFGLSV
jgi:hypothetical protein